MNDREERIQRHLLEMDRLAEEHGVAIQAVGAGEDEPAFAYTVGLARVEHPELIIFGLSMTVAHGLLNDVGLRIARGYLTLSAGDTVHQWVRDYPVRLISVRDSWEHLTVANRLYGTPDRCLPALQAIFPDAAHRWPWEFGSRVAGTPLLGPVPEDWREVTLEDGDD